MRTFAEDLEGLVEKFEMHPGLAESQKSQPLLASLTWDWLLYNPRNDLDSIGGRR